jgi:predicted nuclease of restriction endonuclease-like (RecB) superfamily
MTDTLKLTKSAKTYIEALKDTLKTKYQLSDSKVSSLVMDSYVIESLIDYPEETLHDDIEAHADNIYEDWVGEL